MSISISALPEECLSHILSLTSPVDVLQSSPVSKQFLSASDCDTVWEKFLPSDYNQIISQSLTPVEFRSKKELVLHLCTSHILIDNDTKSFALDKWNLKKCYMLGARSLAIVWGDTPQYWSFTSAPESRFPEVAELKNVCWLEVKGNLHTKLLTPSTTYGVYFVFKLMVGNNFGFSKAPIKVYVSEVDEDGLPTNHHSMISSKSFNLKELESKKDLEYAYRIEPRYLPVKRGDGWMEIEMAKYKVGVDGAKETVVLEMALMEVERGNWKKGLIVHGIEFRPLD